ncbi:MAG: flagellar motor switch protein FliN [Frankiales bacterium]|nr:flagellar motor switch protein FliN [Frankiales bacterium]
MQVELAVELGRVKLPLRDLLSLGPGAVLELDRAADAPVDVLVNGCLVAKGEVVVIDGEFGVRVTAVVER